jgi:hypothetical protein
MGRALTGLRAVASAARHPRILGAGAARTLGAGELALLIPVLLLGASLAALACSSPAPRRNGASGPGGR